MPVLLLLLCLDYKHFLLTVYLLTATVYVTKHIKETTRMTEGVDSISLN